jgi:hypothetical protein
MKIKVKYDLECNGKTYTLKQAGVQEIIEVPDDIEEYEVSDWVSDKTGWCVLDWVEVDNLERKDSNEKSLQNIKT